MNRIWVVFLAVTAIGLFCINNLIDWSGIEGKNGNVDNIMLPQGYSASVALKGLKNPSSFAVDNEGGIYIAENSENSGKCNARIVRYTKEGGFKVICDKLRQPVSFIAFHRGKLYVSRKGAVSMLTDNGLVDLVDGLPSSGDYSNNGIAFGYDGMIYICQGAATNAGVVGLDNMEAGWLKDNAYFHDYPSFDCTLAGLNFRTENPFSSNRHNMAGTGAFLPFNTISLKSESIKGRLPSTASIMRLTTYGGLVDAFAWGIRNPIGIIALPDARVFISNQGMQERGSRPIANGCDYLYEIKKGQWLGWPDYEGGEPVILKKFKPKRQAQVTQFILELHPTLNPPKPIASFQESGRIGYIDICGDNKLGYKGSIFIPLAQGKKENAKIATYDTRTGKLADFALNKPAIHENGVETVSDTTRNALQKPVQCTCTEDGKLYILDNAQGILYEVAPSSGQSTRLVPGAISVEYFIGIIALCFLICVVTLALRKND